MRWKAAGLAVALAAASAQAQCREDVEERLGVLGAAFDDQVRGTTIWSYSWGSIYGTLALTQGAVAATMRHDNPARVDLTFGAIAAGVGALSFLLLPLRFTLPLQRVRAQWDGPDRCALLDKAEATRRRVADEQQLSKSWLAHAGNVLFNLGIVLAMGLGFNHWQAGLISGAVGIAVGEVNLLSAPTHLNRVAEPPPGQLAPIAGFRW